MQKLLSGVGSNEFTLSILLAGMQQRLVTGAALSPHLEAAQERILEWLQCGIAPRQLAFTLALGFAIGCIPLLGMTTAICALLALLLRLNMPAIQAANWLAMPLQVLLLIPFLRLGQWLFRGETTILSGQKLLARVEAAPWRALLEMGSLFAQAVLAWLITAGPALVILTLMLTPLMRRLARLAAPAAVGDSY